RVNYTADTELALSEFLNVALSVAAGRWGRAVPGIRWSVLQRMACKTSHPNLIDSHGLKHWGVLQLCLATKVESGVNSGGCKTVCGGHEDTYGVWAGREWWPA